MTRRLAWITLVIAFVCAIPARAQVLVGTLGQHQFPTGCVTIFSDIPFDVFNNIQIPTMVLPVATSGGAGTAIFPQTTLLIDNPVVDLACATGVSVQAFGILQANGVGFPDGTTLTTATIPVSNQVWSSFAIAFIAPYTISTFTPETDINVTRIEAQVPVSPSHCKTNAVVSVSSGSSAASLTLSGAANDSGPLTANNLFSAGVPVKLSVTTAADCWGGIPPAAANIVVHYKAAS